MKQHKKTVAVDCRVGRSDDLALFIQKDQLTRLANARGYDNLVYYQDNGYSGLDFDRPAFSAMQKDIKAENINRVLVVDISRIGRNTQLVFDWLYKMNLAKIAVDTLDDRFYMNPPDNNI